MKKLFLMLTVFTACFGYGASAQVDVQVNLGLQPAWGPAGYDYAQYYYLPDIDAYYDVAAQQYIYMEDNYWVTRPYLPPRYRGYDLYGGYKVVINQPRPWMNHERYRGEYARYRGYHDQRIIRDNRNARYYGHVRDHAWYGNHGGGYDHTPRQINGPREEHGNWHGGGGHGYEGGHGDGGHGHEGGHGEGGHGEGHGRR